MKIAILTGGGDCPGLNNAIRGVIRTAELNGFEVIGIRDGWKGMIEGLTKELDYNTVERIYNQGGTVLHTSRTNPLKIENGIEKIKENIKKMGIDYLMPIGGDDTLGVAYELSKHDVKVICIPKTIDKDLSSTDYSIGFDTSINIVTDAIDRLKTTAESHHRVMVLEVMGRESGWVSILGGIAGAADFIIIPEKEANFGEIVHSLNRKKEKGENSFIIVVAEGAKLKDRVITQDTTKDQFGHEHLGGIGKYITNRLKEETDFDVRYSNLGHVQRGGAPSAYDRIVGTRLGVKAVDLAKEGIYGKMITVKGFSFDTVDIYEAVKENHLVTDDWFDTARVFF